AHLSNATNADFLRVRVLAGGASPIVFEQLGSSVNRPGAWATANVNLSSFAGRTIRLQVEAADAGSGSLIEAGVDDVRITRSTASPVVVFADDFAVSRGWTLNPDGSDTATSGTWQRTDPQATSFNGVTLQLGTTVSGVNDLVTGGAAGADAGANDVDNG